MKSPDNLPPYVPPSQRSGSEAATAKTLSHLFAPSSLPSIDSSLLPIPSRPHATLPDRPNTSTAHSLRQPATTGPAATSAAKGKQRAQSYDDLQDFIFPPGRNGFTELKTRLAQIQSPIQDALSIASMENSEFTTINTAHARQLLQLLDTLTKVADKATKSIDYCQAATQLPPYPALGLAWMAMANNSNSIDLASSKAVHLLVNSITVVNVNKKCDAEVVPVPVLPGIRQPQQIAIRPRSDQAKVMLSKVSIKDHPHREEIVELAREIHAGEPKHLRKGKNVRDYLLQAKTMFEASQSSTSVTSQA